MLVQHGRDRHHGLIQLSGRFLEFSVLVFTHHVTVLPFDVFTFYHVWRNKSTALAEYVAGYQNLEQFIQKIRKYAELTELTPYAAHELIKAIYVGAPDKSSGKRRQSIHICYDLIGFIPLSELMTQEMA